MQNKRILVTTICFLLVTTCYLRAVNATSPKQIESQHRTFCRYVPERSDDFAWENDKIAFRAYGPALRSGLENGGIDCWLKRVPYPVINKWYKKHVDGGSYHKDSGEGYDPYHVGSSLGCGGIGLWIDGQLINTETFVDWRILKCEPDESVFELDYQWFHQGHNYEMTRLISIHVGQCLFNTKATFRKDGEIASDLPVAIGVTTHDGKAETNHNLEQGWLSCWEEIDRSALGTGVVMDRSKIEKYLMIESKIKDESHSLFISKTDENGQVSWWAGYGWTRAGNISDLSNWNQYLIEFSGI